MKSLTCSTKFLIPVYFKHGPATYIKNLKCDFCRQRRVVQSTRPKSTATNGNCQESTMPNNSLAKDWSGFQSIGKIQELRKYWKKPFESFASLTPTRRLINLFLLYVRSFKLKTWRLAHDLIIGRLENTSFGYNNCWQKNQSDTIREKNYFSIRSENDPGDQKCTDQPHHIIFCDFTSRRCNTRRPRDFQCEKVAILIETMAIVVVSMSK